MKKAITLLTLSLLFWNLQTQASEGEEKVLIERRAAVDKFIRANVINQMETNTDIKSIKYFSRCPSGMGYQLKESASISDKDIYGHVIEWKGCSPENVCFFHVNLEDNVAEVSRNESTTYMSLKAWKNYNEQIAQKK